MCWFAVTRPGLEETCGSKKIFMFIPETFFSPKYNIRINAIFSDRPGVLEKTDRGDGKPTYF